MAESRSARMQVVLTLAQRHEEEAGQRLNSHREQIAMEEQQLKELIAYRDQYLAAQGEARSGVAAQELINYSTFIGRLGEACREQESKLVRMQDGLKKLQQLWREKYQKRKSIEELVTRLGQEESMLLDKRLQKELDELSSQQLERKRSSDNQ